MFSKTWQTSPRRYGIVRDRNVSIPVSGGYALDGDVFRPDSPDGRFPVLVGFFPFDKDKIIDSYATEKPRGVNPEFVVSESGDYSFFVRRGYAQAYINVGGTGRSGGEFDYMGDDSAQELYDAIEWLAAQPWCDGQVATFGTSYWSMTAKKAAALKPPSLKTIFAPWSTVDLYRDTYANGGIQAMSFFRWWVEILDNLRLKSKYRDQIGEEEFDRQIAAALENEEYASHPDFVHALEHPDEGGLMMLVEMLLNPTYTDWWKERTTDVATSEIPGWFGGCWGMHGLHLRGDIRTFEQWRGPKRLAIAPPYYLDRPAYQYQYEALRWFDHYLKGVENGIEDEPAVQVFIQNSGEWRTAEEWPLPETRWTEFYLHEDGLLSEHELWPHETSTTFHDEDPGHGSATFATPPMVESTEICGPMVLKLYGSTTDVEVLWFVDVLEIAPDGVERVLTRGWLRGSHREVDPEKSLPWQPYHTHTDPRPLTPGEITEFDIEIVPTGVLLAPGYRLGIRIKGSDKEDTSHDFIEFHNLYRVWRQTPADITIQHNNAYPSHLLVPITKGNKVGTYMSGGVVGPDPINS